GAVGLLPLADARPAGEPPGQRQPPAADAQPLLPGLDGDAAVLDVWVQLHLQVAVPAQPVDDGTPRGSEAHGGAEPPRAPREVEGAHPRHRGPAVLVAGDTVLQLEGDVRTRVGEERLRPAAQPEERRRRAPAPSFPPPDSPHDAPETPRAVRL